MTLVAGNDLPARSEWPSKTVFCPGCGHPQMTVHFGLIKRTVIGCMHCGYERVWFPKPLPVFLHSQDDTES